jgi:[ribosomal protein S5]-alanine N-acetyltransferase
VRVTPPYPIDTDRLRLRPFLPDDLADYHAVMGQDLVGLELPAGRGFTLEETQSLLETWLGHWDYHGFGPFAVIERDSGDLLGHSGLRLLYDDSDPELLYALRSESWGLGYATEAARGVIDWATRSTRIASLVAYARTENLRSQRVLVNCRFIQVGEVSRWGLELFEYRRDMRR